MPARLVDHQLVTSPRRESTVRYRRPHGTEWEDLDLDTAINMIADRPVLNPPVWEPRDVAGYLFLGGLAGASSALGAGAHATGRTALARASKVGAAGAGLVSLAALVHDLGQPRRFLHMLRAFTVTSPMSVGSWLLAGYVPLAAAATASAITGSPG